jgi:hypothetical protein
MHRSVASALIQKGDGAKVIKNVTELGLNSLII